MESSVSPSNPLSFTRNSHKSPSQSSVRLKRPSTDDLDSSETETDLNSSTSWNDRRSSSSSFSSWSVPKHLVSYPQRHNEQWVSRNSGPVVSPTAWVTDMQRTLENTMSDMPYTDSEGLSMNPRYRQGIDRMTEQINHFLSTRSPVPLHRYAITGVTDTPTEPLPFLSTVDSEPTHSSPPLPYLAMMDNLRKFILHFRDALEEDPPKAVDAEAYFLQISDPELPQHMDINLHDLDPGVSVEPCHLNTASWYQEYSLAFCSRLLDYLDKRESESWYFGATTPLKNPETDKLQARNERLLQALRKNVGRNDELRKQLRAVAQQHKKDIAVIQDERFKDVKYHMIRAQRAEEERRKVMAKLTGLEKNWLNASYEVKLPLETKLAQVEHALQRCEDEKGDMELTLESMRSEMEKMMEELADTKDSNNRYKMQASRLKAGLEAIQGRVNDDDVEQNGIDALRLLRKEAERQAMELERESKRQALVITKLRQDAKQWEDKARQLQHGQTTEKNQLQRYEEQLAQSDKKSKELEILHQRLQKRIWEAEQEASGLKDRIEKGILREQQMHNKFAQLQSEYAKAKRNLQQQKNELGHYKQQKVQTREIEEARENLAKIKADHDQQIANLQHALTQADQRAKENEEKLRVHMRQIQQSKDAENEQAWKAKLQREQEILHLQISRETRNLSGRIAELEADIEQFQRQQSECEVAISKTEKRHIEVERTLIAQRIQWRAKENQLKQSLDHMKQRVNTLEDEALRLYSNNLHLAHELGKWAP